MAKLHPGTQSRQKVDILLAVAGITHGRTVDAIYFHLVQGCGESRSALHYSVQQTELSKALKALNRAAEQCERYHELKVLAA